jgi:hypothetical protein
VFGPPCDTPAAPDPDPATAVGHDEHDDDDNPTEVVRR